MVNLLTLFKGTVYGGEKFDEKNNACINVRLDRYGIL